MIGHPMGGRFFVHYNPLNFGDSKCASCWCDDADAIMLQSPAKRVADHREQYVQLSDINTRNWPKAEQVISA